MAYHCKYSEFADLLAYHWLQHCEYSEYADLLAYHCGHSELLSARERLVRWIGGACTHACVDVCVDVCVCACVRACVVQRVCVCVRVSVSERVRSMCHAAAWHNRCSESE